MTGDGTRLDATSLAMYGDEADWFHLLTAPADYAEEAQEVLGLIRVRAGAEPRTLLELGSGGGNTASHLKVSLELTLVDVSPRMLGLSAVLNPECEHLEGDMRTVRLGRTFDAVLIHDAIGYMTTEADLRAAIETAFVHCRPGGVAVLAPDCVRETFEPATRHGGHDGPERAMRYLEWTYDPDPDDSWYRTDYALLLREADGELRVRSDRHVLGLFGREVWLQTLADVGFEPGASTDAYGRVVFTGLRPLPLRPTAG